MKARKTAPRQRPADQTVRRPRKGEIPGLPEQRPEIGLETTVERVVEPQHTIRAVDPNLPAVFSTPAMIGLMEHASVLAVRPQLPAGAITVGTRIEVDHLKAVGPGARVQAWARLVKYQGRFLVFDVEARFREQVIGRGRVFRAIVDSQKHGHRAQTRIQRQRYA